MADRITVIGQQLLFQNRTYRCAFGKGGFSANKKEGDGATPLGVFPLRECWYRADRLKKPQTKLPLKIIHENDGWCDDPKSEDYNRHVVIPPPAGGRLGGGHNFANEQTMPPPQPSPYGGGSYERLWREDEVYDLIVPLGYNDGSIVPGNGSAIFLHVAHADYRSTEGCVALAKADLLAILPHLGTEICIEIRRE